jgi:hypothetical protein
MTEETNKGEVIRVCYACDSNKTYINWSRGSPHYFWTPNPPIGWLCHKCNCKYIKNPKRKQGFNQKYNDRKILFKNRTVFVEKPPRIGVCNLCRAVTGQINGQSGKICRMTNMHHEEYHDENPLKDAIEACVRCHRYQDKNYPSRAGKHSVS